MPIISHWALFCLKVTKSFFERGSSRQLCDASVHSIIPSSDAFRGNTDLCGWLHMIKPPENPIPKGPASLNVSLLYVFVNLKYHIKYGLCSPMNEGAKFGVFGAD